MNLEIRHTSPDHAVVALIGEHEGYAATRLERALAELAATGYTLEIDLTKTAFIDSETAGVLLKAQREAEEEGREFSVVLGPDTGWPVRRLLEVTGLDAMLGAEERGAQAAASSSRSRRNSSSI